MKRPPKIFHVNWFRMDDRGNFLWPGFVENLRVLEWILDRCNNKVEALSSPIGYLPRQTDIDMTGLYIPEGNLEKLLEIDREKWLEELKGVKDFFEGFKKDLPEELWQEYKELTRRLKS
jgi:phosphoenolpyruvate carboxykinase (GTP)